MSHLCTRDPCLRRVVKPRGGPPCHVRERSNRHHDRRRRRRSHHAVIIPVIVRMHFHGTSSTRNLSARISAWARATEKEGKRKTELINMLEGDPAKALRSAGEEKREGHPVQNFLEGGH